MFSSICYEKSEAVGYNNDIYYEVHVVNDKNESAWICYPCHNNYEPQIDMVKMYILSVTLGFDKNLSKYKRFCREVYGKFTKQMWLDYENDKLLANDLTEFFGRNTLEEYAKEIGW